MNRARRKARDARRKAMALEHLNDPLAQAVRAEMQRRSDAVAARFGQPPGTAIYVISAPYQSASKESKAH